MIKKYLILISLFLFAAVSLSNAQNAQLSGKISDNKEALYGVSVGIPELGEGTITDENGEFLLKNIPTGTYKVIFSLIGFRQVSKTLTFSSGEKKRLDILMQESTAEMDQVVVTGTRSEVPAFEAPVIVSRITAKAFERTQSLTLSEGLNFSTGLRTETNCSNCGFTQARMNGLDGGYSQILINSRPVFSALTGVYGLDFLPQSMIERVEVVRGGGSALYGSNAVAGIINIITRTPDANQFEIGTSYGLINGESPDRMLSLNGSIVNNALNRGLSFFAVRRSREAWDANGDEFSEITRLENTTFGFDAFLKPDEQTELKANLFVIDEFRRGGNDFDLKPHETDITEQLEHQIIGGAFEAIRRSKNQKHRFSLYTSGQFTNRASYYGGGGRVLRPGDSLTDDDLAALNAYGDSDDLTFVGGVQYTLSPNKKWAWVFGSEYTQSSIIDKMPGYSRTIDQEVRTFGQYAQAEFTPSERLTLLGGLRLDFIGLDGLYTFENEVFDNQRSLAALIPRLTAMYELSPSLKLRAAYAQGYRAPQAFDEDLHIETVGGAALFTRLDSDLETERSESFTASLNFAEYLGQSDLNIVLEGFYTRLQNPFITADQEELPSGIAVQTKRNGSGAYTGGMNLEANLSVSERLFLQSGFTLQTARYEEEEVIWESEEDSEKITSTQQMLRTPDAYGFFSVNFKAGKRLDLSASAVFTGAMDVAHVIDPDTEETVIKRTPLFYEQNLKCSYSLPMGEQTYVKLFCGVQNILNSFQNDFDTGAERDASYIFGPSRPRTFFAGLKFGMKPKQ